MSLINHFLGSVLASADIENMRRANPTSPLTTPIMPSSRGTTEAVRTSTPPFIASTSEPSTSNNTNASIKRKNPEPESSSSSDKKPRNEKGKEKD